MADLSLPDVCITKSSRLQSCFVFFGRMGSGEAVWFLGDGRLVSASLASVVSPLFGLRHNPGDVAWCVQQVLA